MFGVKKILDDIDSRFNYVRLRIDNLWERLFKNSKDILLIKKTMNKDITFIKNCLKVKEDMYSTLAKMLREQRQDINLLLNHFNLKIENVPGTPAVPPTRKIVKKDKKK